MEADRCLDTSELWSPLTFSDHPQISYQLWDGYYNSLTVTCGP